MKGKIAKYVTVGTNDLQRAKEFYDQLFDELGVTSFGPNDRSFFWTIPGDDTNFAVFVPYDETKQLWQRKHGRYYSETKEDVDALYAKAIKLGAKDEGEPGQRVPSFYGAYVRDLDGNKLTFCKFG